MQETIVLYPSPGIGHLVPMVEFGKLILKHHPCFSIAIIITTVPYETGSTAPYITAVTTTNPSITFHHLPTIPPPPHIPISPPNIPLLNFEIPRLNNPNLREILVSMSQCGTHLLKAFIIDFFCFASMQVSKELCIPTFHFHISAAHALAVFLYIPMLHRITESLKKEDLSTAIYDGIPGLPTMHQSDLGSQAFDPSAKTYTLFEQSSLSMQDCSGVIINSFNFLEEKVIKTIQAGKCVPNGRTPPIYFIGPLISTTSIPTDEKHACLSWLDAQPSQSVVFLCFGSLGKFSKDQLLEMANGLEKSGVRFLWVVRIPQPNNDNQNERTLANGGGETELINSVMPIGFTERTKDRGFVVRDWVPQMAVLGHPSVGGFLTHCGWNSVLESVCSGVPMLAWPLYNDQKVLRVVLVEEIKIALNVNTSKTGFVTASELSERVLELIDSEKGKELRDRVKMFRDAAVVAMGEGGSSRVDLSKFVDLLKMN